MRYEIKPPIVERMDAVIDLCEKHAEYEKSEYSRIGKAEKLRLEIFKEKPKLYCRVVEIGEKYVGYITWTKQYSTWESAEYLYMDCLFLEENYRGYGIGKALVKTMVTFGKQKGMQQIQWQTPEFNARAINFYKMLGATALTKERFFLNI